MNAIKLDFKPEPETWQRHPYIVSWSSMKDFRGEDMWSNRMIREMQEFLNDSNIQHSKFMVKDSYGGTGPYVFSHAGFRFLTETDATIFWLRFQGE